jgi:large subunit ribosomal protein L13
VSRKISPLEAMATKGTRTYFPTKAELGSEWVVVDATGASLGRLASYVAQRLMGKHKPTYSPHLPCGDHVVVINVDRLAIDEKKAAREFYYRHSGYPGGLKATSYLQIFRNRPETLFRKVVWGMLPKNRLGRSLLSHLKVYRGPDHPHEAQKPRVVEVPQSVRRTRGGRT